MGLSKSQANDITKSLKQQKIDAKKQHYEFIMRY